jgi:hypothetical protein
MPAQVLIFANQTATSTALLDAVGLRADRGDCAFTLLVPATPHGLHRIVDPEDHGIDDAYRTLGAALPGLEAAAGAPVAGMIGSHDPLAAVADAINLNTFDEVIISTLPLRLSRWLRLDLPHKVSALGLPVLTVVSHDRAPVARRATVAA